MARITKTFEGVPKTAFTTADNYVVQIHAPQPEPLHTLIVASALSIDTALKQDARGLNMPQRCLAPSRLLVGVAGGGEGGQCREIDGDEEAFGLGRQGVAVVAGAGREDLATLDADEVPTKRRSRCSGVGRRYRTVRVPVMPG